MMDLGIHKLIITNLLQPCPSQSLIVYSKINLSDGMSCCELLKHDDFLLRRKSVISGLQEPHRILADFGDRVGLH